MRAVRLISGITLHNVVHRHFVWCQFQAWHIDAAVQNCETRFSAWATESDDEPIMCGMSDERAEIEYS